MAEKNLTIVKGSTFSLVVRWANGDVIVRKPITAISLAAGAPRLTVAGHGIPNGWPCWVTRVAGMKQINSEDRDDTHPATVIDANTIEFNDVSPVDDSGREWPDYTSGGFVEWYEPIDLTGYAARMQIKDKIGGTVLASTELADAPNNTISVTVDAVGYKITIKITAADNAGYSFKKGVTHLEMVKGADVFKVKLCSGDKESPDQVVVEGEVTT